MSGEAERLAAVCQRLAETQQNMPVPLRADERADLREAARLLRTVGSWAYRATQRVLDEEKQGVEAR